MKHLFLLFSFILVASFSSNAQCSKSASAGKACCASKKTASADVKSDAKVASFVMEAEAKGWVGAYSSQKTERYVRSHTIIRKRDKALWFRVSLQHKAKQEIKYKWSIRIMILYKDFDQIEL